MNQKQFTVVKKGFDPQEVEEYTQELLRQIQSYQSKEAAIHEAIISAQIAANKIIEEAKAEANKIKMKILEQVAAVGEGIIEVEEKMSEFQEEYKIMVQKYLTDFVEEDLQKTKSVLQEVKDMVANEVAPRALMIQEDQHYKGTQAEKLEAQTQED